MQFQRPKDRKPENAWYTSDCIVAKVSQYAYDYVCFNLIGESTTISKYAETLSQLWIDALIIQVR